MYSDDHRYTPDQDLDWYFSYGIIAFQRSFFGSLLDHAKNSRVQAEGKRAEPTARPTAETRHHGGYDVSESDLFRYGRVSRTINCCSPTSRAVLEAWHGDLGARFARTTQGRVAALFLLVPSGQALVARARRRASKSLLELSDVERLVNEITLDSIQGSDAERRKLITYASLEARKLYQYARREYENGR